MPGADDAIKAATATGDWVVVLLVILVLAMGVGCGWAFRYLFQRVADLDSYIQTTLAGIATEATKALVQSTVTNAAVVERLNEIEQFVKQLCSRLEASSPPQQKRGSS